MEKKKKVPAKKAVVAKAVAKKTAPKKESKTEQATQPAWKTINVFGYGETQLAAPDNNRKVASDTLKTLPSLLEYLASKQQKGTKISMKNAFAVNIFNGLFINFLPNSQKNKPQRFTWNEVDKKLVDKLYKELLKQPANQSRRGQLNKK